MLLPRLFRSFDPGLSFGVGYFVPWKDALVGEIRDLGVSVICFDAASPVAMLARRGAVANWIRRERFDLVHCHLPMSGVVARLAGRAAGIPVVYTEHNLQERYRFLTRQANRMTWSAQDAVVAVSEQVADSIDRLMGSRVPVRVIHNGVPSPSVRIFEEQARKLRQSMGFSPDRIVIGTLAVFRKQKRLDHWIEVAARARSADPRLRFLIVGDGPLRAQIAEKIATVGLSEVVRMPGLQNEPRPWLAAMDIFMSTSQFEGLPLALLEAMAMARPVIATRVGGVPEAVESGESGILSEFGDIDGLSAAVVRLAADSGARARIGEAARARIMSAFSMERMASGLESLYLSVTANASR